MEDNSYLEKILGEKYNMADYFERDTYPNSNTRVYADPPESLKTQNNNSQQNLTMENSMPSNQNTENQQSNMNVVNNMPNNKIQAENDPMQNNNIEDNFADFLKGTDTGEINVFNTQNEENINLNSNNQITTNNSNNGETNSNNINQSITNNSQKNNVQTTEKNNSNNNQKINSNSLNNQSNVQQNISQPNMNTVNSVKTETAKRDPKEEIKKLLEQDIYPDLYKILHPMIRVVLEKYKGKPITISTIEEMSKEIYSAFVTDENSGKSHNYILHDLIRILIIFALKDSI